ncbi:MAG: hypothetical protein AAFZ07_29230, partial [Actinomycetota bacterium]
MSRGKSPGQSRSEIDAMGAATARWTSSSATSAQRTAEVRTRATRSAWEQLVQRGDQELAGLAPPGAEVRPPR